MKHWTKLLPEAGRKITYLGDDQETKLMQIQLLEQKVESLKKQYDIEDILITMKAKEDWTIDEIQEAKNRANNNQKASS
jgi:metal-sulfur cluster biosynthetic enzyme